MAAMATTTASNGDGRKLRLFVLLSVVHVALSLFVPALPGWKMFSRVVPFQYRLVDAAGRAVRFDDIAPLPHYLTGPGPVQEAAEWLAQRDNAPVGLSVRAGGQWDLLVLPTGSTSECGEQDRRRLCQRLRSAWEDEGR